MSEKRNKNKVQNNRKNNKPRKKKNGFRETSEAILVALLAALLLRAFVIQAFRIPTGSMKDTLLVGDFLLVNKFIYGVRTPDRIPFTNAEIPFWRLPSFKQPQRGDVVVFKYPLDPSLDYIKRCIAVAGDTLEVRNGDVFINGRPEGGKKELGPKYDAEDGTYITLIQITTPTNKKYVIRHYQGHNLNDPTHNFGPKIIPPGNYFMMGDNRDNSADSRSWGFLPQENVVGEALIIYFSWDKAEDWWNLLQSVRWSRVADLIR